MKNIDKKEFFKEIEVMVLGSLKKNEYSQEAKNKMLKVLLLMKNKDFRDMVEREIINKD